MTEEQFWHGDLRLLQVYQKSYYRNLYYQAYISGFYNNIAVSVSLGNAFRKKGQKPIAYPEKPIDPFEKTEKLNNEKIEKRQNSLLMENIQRIRALKGE